MLHCVPGAPGGLVTIFGHSISLFRWHINKKVSVHDFQNVPNDLDTAVFEATTDPVEAKNPSAQHLTIAGPVRANPRAAQIGPAMASRHSMGSVSAKLRADGRFSEQDYTQCTQIFAERYAHRVLIRSKRHVCQQSRDACMWWTPSRLNFEPLTNSVFPDLGRFHAPQLSDIDDLTMTVKRRAYTIMGGRPSKNWQDMEFAVTNMRHGVMRLLYNPYTFKEMVLDVAQTQRYYLDALAMCEFAEGTWATRFARIGPLSKDVCHDRLGAWSTDPATVQKLHHAGIPVYYVRTSASLTAKTRIRRVLSEAVRDVSIVTGDWEEDGVVMSFPERYIGAPSDALHQALSEDNRYRDLEVYFMELNGDRALAPVGSKARMAGGEHVSKRRPKQAKGIQFTSHMQIPARDKWHELKDKSERSSCVPPKAVSGYRFPDRGMVIYSEGQRECNLFNWLAIREATIRRASNDAASGHAVLFGVSNELWRLYIANDFHEAACGSSTAGGSASRNRSDNITRRQLLIDIIGRPPDARHLRHIEWNGFMVEWGKITMHDNLLVREIIWDLHQWSFQYDLIAIDRYLAPDAWARGASSHYMLLDAVCGDNSVLGVVPRPHSDFGLAASEKDARLRAYEALQTLMISCGGVRSSLFIPSTNSKWLLLIVKYSQKP
ncbi:hypothetical protein HWV62_42681 [Athelia sp. TMB]|nr:hypothetical protein HWV62_42681 [Athelia sp. TMB]